MLKEKKIPHVEGCLQNEKEIQVIKEAIRFDRLAELLDIESENRKVLEDLKKRLESIEGCLEFHGFLIGEFDLDQIRQDAKREIKVRVVDKNTHNILKLKQTQDRIIKKVNNQ
jgi:hypothetical protein